MRKVPDRQRQRQDRRIQEPQVEQLRVGVGGNCSGPDGPAVFQDHTFSLLCIAAALQDHLADRCGNLDLHAPALG
jgi:hypothetical protein